MKDLLAQEPVSRTALWATAGLLALSALPHGWNLPPAILLGFFVVVGLRLAVWPRPAEIPGLWLRLPLVLSSLVLVAQQTGFHEGRRFGVALLVLMAGLKVLETRTRRDLMMAVFLGYFLLITLFLFSRSALITAWVLGLTILYTALLVLTSRPRDRQGPREALRTALRLTLGAVPVMVIFFLLFPRLDHPLWHLDLGRPQAITGLSETLRMGSVAALGQSEAVAFRASFDGPPPPPADRYWRTLVLWHTDGRTWRRVAAPVADPLFQRPPGAYSYRVILEPTGQRWLPTLDRLLDADLDFTPDSDGQLTSETPVRERLAYRALSLPPPWRRPLTPRERALGLQLPDRVSPRVRALAQSWRARAADDAAVVRQALDHFHNQPFVYTLQPPLLEGDPVDQFLFETRKGFCEHYAASFVLLMRLARVPARLIAGYLGGEVNPLGGHLVIHQYDAHAWAEVWLPGQGWTRVDPTAAVAPERVERGIQPQAEGLGAPARFQSLEAPDLVRRLARQLAWLRDDLQFIWHDWILDYDQRRQQRLLDRLGLQGLGPTRLAVLAMVGALLLAATLYLLTQRRDDHPDPAARAWRRFRRKLARAGLKVPPAAGPLDTARLARRRFPARAGQIQTIVETYVALRYGPNPDPRALARLRRNVRRLRL